MTDTCTPPPGTKDGTRHWLGGPQGRRAERAEWVWSWGRWEGFKPSYLVSLGYQYIGPVEADTPTGIPADWTDCAQCGARRFYPSGQCMQYCDKKPSPPDAKDALPDPNPWMPMSNALDIKHLGKLAEEANELGSAIARCLIQVIDEREPVSGKPNRQWLTEEIADVLANIDLVIAHFDLPISAIEARKSRKISHLKQWYAMLSPASGPS